MTEPKNLAESLSRHSWWPAVRKRLKIPEDWAGLGPLPKSFETIHFALGLLDQVCSIGISAPQVVSDNCDGGVQFEWHTELTDIELDIICPNEVDAWRMWTIDGGRHENNCSLTDDFTVVAKWLQELLKEEGSLP